MPRGAPGSRARARRPAGWARGASRGSARSCLRGWTPWGISVGSPLPRWVAAVHAAGPTGGSADTMGMGGSADPVGGPAGPAAGHCPCDVIATVSGTGAERATAEADEIAYGIAAANGIAAHGIARAPLNIAAAHGIAAPGATAASHGLRTTHGVACGRRRRGDRRNPWGRHSPWHRGAGDGAGRFPGPTSGDDLSESAARCALCGWCSMLHVVRTGAEVGHRMKRRPRADPMGSSGAGVRPAEPDHMRAHAVCAKA